MIADIIFLNVPYAYSSRQIPVGDAISEDWVITTISNVKCSEDLTQSISVPTFDDYSEANMVKINTNYYFIGSYNTKTYQEEVVTFEIVYNAITTNLEVGTELTGMFERIPYDLDKKISFTVKDDALVRERIVPFDGLLREDKPLYFVQITSSYGLKNGGKPGIYRYYLVAYDPYNLGTRGGSIYVNTSPNAFILAKLPNIMDVIKDITGCTALPSDSIIDISISRRSPFTVEKEKITHLGETIDITYFNLENIRIGAHDTGKAAPDFFVSNPPAGQSSFVPLNYAIFPDDLPYRRMEKAPVTITLTDKELHLGILGINDENGNVVATIPKELAVNNRVTVEYESLSDYTGLYTYVHYGDNVLKIPEGKLPWVGSNWKDYQIRSMSSDRAELNLSIQTARTQRNIDLAEGAANAISTGVIGAVATGNPLGSVAGLASFAGSAIGAEARGRLGESVAREDMNIRHGRVKDSTPSSFNTMYGLLYIENGNILGGAGFRLDMPSDTNDDEYNNYVNNWGYPTSGLRTVGAYGGFIKGMLTSSIIGGLKGDMLNGELVQGVRIIGEVAPIVTPEEPEEPIDPTVWYEGDIAYMSQVGATLPFKVSYEKIDAKGGFLRIKGTIKGISGVDNNTFFKIFSILKIRDLIGKNLRYDLTRVTGRYDSDVIDTGYGGRCRVVGDSIEVGRYYNPAYDFGGWSLGTLNNKEIDIRMLYVEEVV